MDSRRIQAPNDVEVTKGSYESRWACNEGFACAVEGEAWSTMISLEDGSFIMEIATFLSSLAGPFLLRATRVRDFGVSYLV